MKLDIEVNHRDIAETYLNGGDWYDRYYRICGMLGEGMTSEQIIRNTGNEVCLETISKYRRGNRPRCFFAIDALNERGLLPMDPDHEAFQMVNLLASMLFWRGTRSKTTRPNSTIASNRFDVKPGMQYDLVKQALEALGATYRDTARSHLVCDNATGRLIEALGYPTGGKKENGLLWPEYIEKLFQHCRTEDQKEELFDLAIELLRDFIDTMLVFRTKVNRDIAINLNTHNDEATARKHANKVVEAIQMTRPDIEPRLDQPYQKRTGTWNYRVRFPRSTDVDTIVKNYRERIMQVTGL